MIWRKQLWSGSLHYEFKILTGLIIQSTSHILGLRISSNPILLKVTFTTSVKVCLCVNECNITASVSEEQTEIVKAEIFY